jgi:hypothetical protein
MNRPPDPNPAHALSSEREFPPNYPFAPGQRVALSPGLASNPGPNARPGVIVRWEGPNDPNIFDSDGPVVRFDDDGSERFFPGQSMAVLLTDGDFKIAQDEAAPRFVDSAHGAHVVVRIECDEPWAREDLELWLAEAPETLRLTLVGRLNPGIDPKMVTGQPTDAERALGIKRV